MPITLLMPSISLLTYGIMRLTGMPIRGHQFALPAALAMVLAFGLAAFGEEVGWSGYVIDPLQHRWARSGAAFWWALFGPSGTTCR